jgi:hypothetical protein
VLFRKEVELMGDLQVFAAASGQPVSTATIEEASGLSRLEQSITD